MKFTIKGSYNKLVIISFWDHNEGGECSKIITINISPSLDPLIVLYEISHMHSIRPIENDSLFEIDNDPKDREEGVQK